MPAEYGQALTDAATIFDLFTAGKVKMGVLTFGATAATDALVHGLGAAPEFVLIACSEACDFSWAADTTTLTVTRTTTVGAATWSYLIGLVD